MVDLSGVPESSRPMADETRHRRSEIAHEQEVVDHLYSLLSEAIASTTYRLDRAVRDPISGTPASINDREAMVTNYAQRLSELENVNDRLCFGRLDLQTGERRYVGRIGLSNADQSSALMDWRAPAAAPFYQATGVNPMGVVRRRHISVEDQRVESIDDDVLMIDQLDEQALATVTGADSLLTALDANRTGRLQDIVATIQAEQDEIIRSPMQSPLVVEGGPGTGKTIVALHRIAYLLYTHRDRIARSGALIVGPNREFISYIDHVLPALGETGVLLRTLDEFVPGVRVGITEEPATARLKGSDRMAELIATAVQQLRRVPSGDELIDHDGTTFSLRRHDVESAVRRGVDSRLPYNEARENYAKDALMRLARQCAQARRMDTDFETVNYLAAELRDNPAVRRAINRVWLPFTPTQFLARLFGDEEKLRAAGPWLREQDVALLCRTEFEGWSSSDIPLIDEAAELLGSLPPPRTRANDQTGSERYAAAALAESGAAGMITAADYQRRFESQAARVPLLERAEADPHWVFGHVVVDEAQDLTPMQWRMIMRRIPTKSMTIVGDPAQASAPGAARDWQAALGPFVEDRWRLTRLTVNYRTPAKIMQLAAHVHDVADLPGVVSQSVRDGSWPIEFRPTTDLLGELHRAVVEDRQLYPAGSTCVIATTEVISRAAGQLPADPGLHVLTPKTVKGLEFDTVIIVEPALMPAPTLANDLYVSITRPTQRLTIVHEMPLPDVLAGAIV